MIARDDPSKAISYGTGVNESEEILKLLGDDSFLRFWSHANLHVSKGQELCDLLVVCGDNVIAFEDKVSEFNESIDSHIAWQRWFGRSIRKSSEKLLQVRRRLQREGVKVYLDARCKEELKVPIPSPDRMQLHLVSVASVPTKSEREVRQPILSFDSRVKGEQHVATGAEPFLIGDVKPTHSFIHVIDGDGLNSALTTLDIVTDFTRYLNARYRFLRFGVANTAASENSMLAAYLVSFDREGAPLDIDWRSPGKVMLDNSPWASSEFREMMRQRILANRSSYIWDEIIDNHAKLFETSKYDYANYSDLESAEKAVRQMALESRLSRRLLSESWLEHIQRDDLQHSVGLRTVRNPANDLAIYIFLTLRRTENLSDKEFREGRRDVLQTVMLASLDKFPEARVVTGIASEIGRLPAAYDLAHLDVEDVQDPEDFNRAIQVAVAKKNEFFKSVGITVRDERDFPVI